MDLITWIIIGFLILFILIESQFYKLGNEIKNNDFAIKLLVESKDKFEKQQLIFNEKTLECFGYLEKFK